MPCLHCPLVFQQKRLLTAHYDSWHKFLVKIYFYQCFTCGKTFKEQESGNFHVHMRNHINEKNHKCEICHKKFGTISNLNDHLNRHNATKQVFLKLSTYRPYQCQNCEKTYYRNYLLTKHIKKHHPSILDFSNEMTGKSNENTVNCTPK